MAQRNEQAQTLSLLEGATVVTTDPWGRITHGGFHGIYHRDVRLVSRYDVTVDAQEPSVLQAARRCASRQDAAFATAFTPEGDARAVLLRCREVSTERMTDRYELYRLVPGEAMVVRIELEADFAELLEVKHVGGVLPVVPFEPTGDGIRAANGTGNWVRVVVPDGDAHLVSPGTFEWTIDADTDAWSLTLEVVADGATATDHDGHRAAPVEALGVSSSDHRWGPAVTSAIDDLRGLWMHTDTAAFIGAGAPWFMALFGRDSLLTAYSSLPAGGELALSTLEALAARQGTRHDPRTLEQPGRILHELRTGHVGVFGLPPGTPYYGSTDATPLFVYVLAEAYRWGADEGRVAALLPAARAALAWCRDHGDIDGDGLVESVPHAGGIENQGWKDSGDSMVHADGSFAQGPFALVEVQAYVYGALQGLALLEERIGDATRAPALRTEAAVLKERFRARFWLEEHGLLAMALDATGQPLIVAASNMGHALWTGILDDDLATRVGERLLQPDLTCSWGIRTVGAEERSYSPLAYHRGSVWPHDTAIVIHGLARSGARAAARQVASHLLDAAQASGWRLPELLAGFDREVVAAPVPYPAACNPQAWSATAPLLALRAVLGLEPDVPAGVVRVDPELEPWESIEVDGVRLGDRSVRVVASGGHARIEGHPDLAAVTSGRTEVVVSSER